MSYGISAKSSVEVRAAAAAFRLAPKEIKRIVTTDTKGAFKADWQAAVRRDAAGPPHGAERARLLRAGVGIIGTQPIKLTAYKAGRLPGGLVAKDDYAALEFGDARKTYEKYQTRSPKGKRYTVRRRTQEQLPPRISEGYSVYPNVAVFVPRMVSYWIQSIIRAYYEAAASKGV
jgi:hypothetical protein